jgi:hypothetical protein
MRPAERFLPLIRFGGLAAPSLSSLASANAAAASFGFMGLTDSAPSPSLGISAVALQWGHIALRPAVSAGAFNSASHCGQM